MEAPAFVTTSAHVQMDGRAADALYVSYDPPLSVLTASMNNSQLYIQLLVPHRVYMGAVLGLTLVRVTKDGKEINVKDVNKCHTHASL